MLNSLTNEHTGFTNKYNDFSSNSCKCKCLRYANWHYISSFLQYLNRILKYTELVLLVSLWSVYVVCKVSVRSKTRMTHFHLFPPGSINSCYLERFQYNIWEIELFSLSVTYCSDTYRLKKRSKRSFIRVIHNHSPKYRWRVKTTRQTIQTIAGQKTQANRESQDHYTGKERALRNAAMTQTRLHTKKEWKHRAYIGRA